MQGADYYNRAIADLLIRSAEGDKESVKCVIRLYKKNDKDFFSSMDRGFRESETMLMLSPHLTGYASLLVLIKKMHPEYSKELSEIADGVVYGRALAISDLLSSNKFNRCKVQNKGKLTDVIYESLKSSLIDVENHTLDSLISAIQKPSEPQRPLLNFKAIWGGAKESAAHRCDNYDYVALRLLHGLATNDALDFCMNFFDVPCDYHPSTKYATTEIIFCDTHAEHINGFERANIEEYYNDLKIVEDMWNMKVTKLSEIHERYLEIPDNKEKYLAELEKANAKYGGLVNDPPMWFPLEDLVDDAIKHCWTGANLIETVKEYLVARSMDHKVFKEVYPLSIFVGFGAPNEWLFTDAPIIYPKISKGDDNFCPWFRDERNQPFEKEVFEEIIQKMEKRDASRKLWDSYVQGKRGPPAQTFK